MSKKQKNIVQEIYTTVRSRHAAGEIIFGTALNTRYNSHFDFLVIDKKARKVTVYTYKRIPSGNDTFTNLVDAMRVNKPESTRVHTTAMDNIQNIIIYKSRIKIILIKAVATQTLNGQEDSTSSSPKNTIMLGSLQMPEQMQYKKIYSQYRGPFKHDPSIEISFKNTLQDQSIKAEKKTDWIIKIINLLLFVGALFVIYSLI